MDKWLKIKLKNDKFSAITTLSFFAKSDIICELLLSPIVKSTKPDVSNYS